MHLTQDKQFSEVLFIVAVCYNDEGWILIKKKDESHKQAVMMITMMSDVKLMYFNVECC